MDKNLHNSVKFKDYVDFFAIVTDHPLTLYNA